MPEKAAENVRGKKGPVAGTENRVYHKTPAKQIMPAPGLETRGYRLLPTKAITSTAVMMLWSEGRFS